MGRDGGRQGWRREGGRRGGSDNILMHAISPVSSCTVLLFTQRLNSNAIQEEK